jgi:hypothetical protein
MSAARLQPARKGLAETYAGEFALVGVSLPLQPSAKPGEVIDADGRCIAVVPNTIADDEALRLAALIAQGVNWFANVRQPTSPIPAKRGLEAGG